jgi:PHD/YefM family antitoxin component YafN of YafNO toxin-antitoxin module
LGFYQLNSDWYLYAFKAVDPQGYLRRFRFNLTLPYYYYTLNNKGEVATVLNRLAKAGVTVSNQEQFNRDMEQERVYRAGTHQGLVRLLQKAKRKRVTGKTYTLSIDEVELQYVVMDGVPMLFVEEVFSKESTEAKGLKASGFEYGPSLWRRQVTRSILVKILKDFIARAPQLKIADWDAFKSEAHRIFKGLNLVDFDEVGES